MSALSSFSSRAQRSFSRPFGIGDTSAVTGVSSVASLRGLAAGLTPLVVLSPNASSGATIYRWDAASTLDDNGTSVVRPNSVDDDDPGRWIGLDVQGAYNVRGFGAVGDGATDDVDAIQDAIDLAAGANGGVVYFPPGDYAIGSDLIVEGCNVLLIGDGQDISHTVGDQMTLAATRLTWIGAAGGTMVHIRSLEGVSARKLFGCEVANIAFESGSTSSVTGAAIGLQISSIDQGRFENLFFHEFTECGIKVDCVTTLGDLRDSRNNKFINCHSRNSASVTGGLVILEGDSQPPSSGTGGTGTVAGVSLNLFERCSAEHYNGTGFRMKNADHNAFVLCHSTKLAGGSGNGMVFDGSNLNTDAVARENYVFMWKSDTAIVAKGTTTNTYPSRLNTVLWADGSNPDPSIETAASCWVHFRTDGSVADLASSRAAFSTSRANAVLARARLTNESLRIEGRNAENLHIARQSTDGLTIEGEFSVAVDSSLNLKFRRATGTGAYAFTDAAITMEGSTVIDTNRHFLLRSYTVASLPSASPAGQMIYVSNETGGATLAFSDGTNWRRVSDRAVVA